MARREKDVYIHAEGRDHKKVFVLREFSARQAEWLAYQIFQALIKSGAMRAEDQVAQMGVQGLAIVGFEAFGKLDPITVKPLLDEMMKAVIGIRPDPTGNPTFVRPLVDDDIEEVSTLFTLRLEIFSLHTGFSLPVVPSTGSTSETPTGSSTIPTSQPRSAQSSRQAVRR